MKSQLPQYKVILYNDDFHSISEVVRDLHELFPEVDYEDLTEAVVSIHLKGSLVIAISHLELAETYKRELELLGYKVSLQKKEESYDTTSN